MKKHFGFPKRRRLAGAVGQENPFFWLKRSDDRIDRSQKHFRMADQERRLKIRSPVRDVENGFPRAAYAIWGCKNRSAPLVLKSLVLSKKAVGIKATPFIDALRAIAAADNLLSVPIALAHPLQGVSDHAEVERKKGDENNWKDSFVYSTKQRHRHPSNWT